MLTLLQVKHRMGMIICKLHDMKKFDPVEVAGPRPDKAHNVGVCTE
jgi:hypothetical protein